MRGQYLGQALCCLVCDAKVRVEAGQAVGWYRDYAPNLAAPDAAEFICPSCAMLEDLDPDWPDNQSALAWVPVRRKMPIQIRESLAELFTERSTGKAAGETPPGMLWVSLPVGCGFDLYNHVRPSQALIDMISLEVKAMEKARDEIMGEAQAKATAIDAAMQNLLAISYEGTAHDHANESQ